MAEVEAPEAEAPGRRGAKGLEMRCLFLVLFFDFDFYVLLFLLGVLADVWICLFGGVLFWRPLYLWELDIVLFLDDFLLF